MPPDAINLGHVDQALQTLVNRGAAQSSRFPPSPPQSDITYTSRNNFLYIAEQNGAVYESVRALIRDQEYWRTEESHFELLNSLILDYNYQQGNFVTLSEAACPPVAVISNMFDGICSADALYDKSKSCKCTAKGDAHTFLELNIPPSPPSLISFTPRCQCHKQRERRPEPARKIGKQNAASTPRVRKLRNPPVAFRTRSKQSLKKISIEQILQISGGDKPG